MLARQLISDLLNSGLPSDEVAGCFRLPVDIVEACRVPETDQVEAIQRWLKLVELDATETWRPIDEHYEVSTFGNVRRAGRMLKPGLDSDGYLMVTLYKLGKVKTHRVHRLVAAAFLGESTLHTLHADNNKTNNRLSNLSYGTHAKNLIDAIKTGAWHQNRSSKFFGVSWDKRNSKWRTVVNYKHLGYFATEVEAAAAANLAIITSHSQLPLNWIPDE